jgi:O-antigen ligase
MFGPTTDASGRVTVVLLALYAGFLPWWNTGATAALVALVLWGLPRFFRTPFYLPRAFWPLWAAFLVALVWAFWDGGWAAVLRFLPWILVVPALQPWPAAVRVRGWLLGVALGVLWLIAAQTARILGYELPSLNPADSHAAARVASARAFGGVGHQHVYWALYAFLALVAVAEQKVLGRWRWVAAAVLLGAAWLGGSKMAVLSLLLGAWIWAGMHPAAFRWRWLVRGALVAGAVAVVFIFIQNTDARFQQERLLHPKPEWATGSFETRSVQWQAAARLWAEQPWTGRGAAHKQMLLEEEYRRLGYWFGEKRHLNVHNTYLEFLLAYGLLGVASVVLALLAAVRVSALFRVQHATLRLPEERAGRRAQLWACAVVLFLVALSESLTERALGVHLIALYAFFVGTRPEVSNGRSEAPGP